MASTERGFSEGLPLVRPLDEEQTRLVEILLAAGGTDVSFEELRRHGIENPAVLAYELEIAGLPIAHVQRVKTGGRANSVGLRLEGAAGRDTGSEERAREAGFLAPAPADDTEPGAAGPLAVERAGPGLLPLAVTAVSAVMLIVLLVALLSGTGPSGGAGNHARLALKGSGAAGTNPSGHPEPPPLVAANHKRHSSSRTSHRAAAAEPAPPPSPAARLQLAGHQLLAEGRYAAAIPKLREAIGASGESASNCSEPTTPGCLAYAEALYDLGRALRLDNAPAAAGAVLRERLQIDSQRDAVRHEIGLNRRHRTHTPARSRHTHTHTRTPRATAKSKPAPEPHPNPGGAAAPAPPPAPTPQTQAQTGSGAPASGSDGSPRSGHGGSTTS
ncbi:MAG TPA: hypothetical protein VLZ06_09110 [Solirubrobacteraceae bacterium]|nr:hypothetical protein [Solirubrobacteraceae bacterium]